MLCRALVVALGVLTMTVPPALSSDAPPAIAALDPSIVHVRMVGNWGDSAGAEVARLIFVRDSQTPSATRLYVQWLMAGAVAATNEVPEFAAGNFVILDIRPDQGEREIAVHLHVRDASGNEPSPLLLIREPGILEYQNAGN